MKKVILIFTVLFITISCYSQDSIVNFLDGKGKIVDKKNALEIETIVRKDTLWKVTNYYRNGKIKKYGHFKTKSKENPIGEFINFNRKGKITRVSLYNLNGKKNGRHRAWFDNGNVNSIGIYLDGKREGKWKYYHYNGNEACRQYYKKDSIIRTIIYDESGNEIQSSLVKFKEPQYAGGVEKFRKRLKKLHNNLDYQVVGKVYLNFNIDIEGNIADVETSEKLPKKLERQIRIFLENTKGWKPAIHMNRRYPYNYEIPLNFSVSFNE